MFFIFGLGGLSLLTGAISQLVERPKFKVLKPQNNYNFAFTFDWPFAKDQAKIDYIKFSLFNPFGNPTRSELVRSFKPQDQTFAHEVEMGQSLANFLGANGFNKAEVSVEIGSSKQGINYFFSYKGAKFQELIKSAKQSITEQQEILKLKDIKEMAYIVPGKSFIADPLPTDEGTQLVVPTNPAFQALFTGSGGGGAGGASAAAENFKVAKVWIEPGCIVCNACEGIFPEVFEVLPDTCVVRTTAPLDNGLRIQEAAEACPVEVIKFAKV